MAPLRLTPLVPLCPARRVSLNHPPPSPVAVVPSSCPSSFVASPVASFLGAPFSFTLLLSATQRRVGGDAAILFLGNIRDKLTVVSLDEREYFQMVEEAAAAKLAGGAVYDALLGYCALKVHAETLYTWNTKDFLRLPPAISNRVRHPDQ